MKRITFWSRRWQGRFYTLFLFLVVPLLPWYWGGNRPEPLLYAEVAAIAVLGYFFLFALWSKERTLPHLFNVLVPVAVVAPWVYLISLPVAVIEALPGRQVYVDLLVQTGAVTDQSWLPVSLNRFATESSYLAFLVPVAVFVAALNVERQVLTRLILVVLGVGAAQAMLGLLQYGGGPESLFRFGNPYFTDSAVGTFANRNHLAGFLEMCLAMALAVFASLLVWGIPGHRFKGRHRSFDVHFNAALLMALLIILLLSGLFVTRSRTGVALAVTGVVLAAVVFARRLDRKKLMTRGAAIVGVTVMLSAVIGVAPVLERFVAADHLGDVRWQLYPGIWAALVQFFPLGSGPGTFAYVFKQFQPDGLDQLVNHAHNDYLEWVVETGLLAVVMTAGFMFSYVRQGLSLRGSDRPFTFLQIGAGLGMLLMLLHGLVDFNFRIPANAVLFALLSGIFFYPVTGVAEAPRPRRRPSVRRRSPPPPSRAGKAPAPNPFAE